MNGNHKPVVWFIDDEINELEPYVLEVQERGLEVQQANTADAAMDLIDRMSDGRLWECDLLVLDMKMSVPKEERYRSRLPPGRLHSRRVGAYILEDVRNHGLKLPVIVLSQYSPEVNLDAIWECYVVTMNLRDDTGVLRSPPASAQDGLAELEREFDVRVREKKPDEFSRVVEEIVRSATLSLQRKL